MSCAHLRSRPRPAVEHAEVVSNERIAKGVGQLVLHGAALARRRVRPGQFVAPSFSPRAPTLVLRRPFSACTAHRAISSRIVLPGAGHGDAPYLAEMAGRR